MTTPAITPRPSASTAGADTPPEPSAADRPHGPAFEALLRESERAHEEAAAGEPPLPAVPPAWPRPEFLREDVAPEVGLPAPAVGSHGQGAGPEALAEGPRAPAPSLAPEFARLAEAGATPGAAARFEVLQGTSVTAVAIDRTAAHGTTVTITAPAGHAAVLDHHLPQLQRRLADRVTARVRTGDRPDGQDR